MYEWNSSAEFIIVVITAEQEAKHKQTKESHASNV